MQYTVDNDILAVVLTMSTLIVDIDNQYTIDNDMDNTDNIDNIDNILM